ncbi:Ribulose-phosphate 3-epimerase [Mesoplasma florum W37]|uniref:Ribulose-phosphate 3-epimerase n=1 Tax=Mesoplasma florum TaxID=2151 RepID=A0AAD2JDG4_MESFO|nr:ribulose-phosphate 3-epimerase [Mesoplasma florum]AGY41379.1 Ribulose-phosphate 3-epimerase [Mesoplasma florum W37]ATI73264.1 ribulose-phosphate 3-epimerase [Mesoplasma florum]AVN59602.1 ribulose-phosphate 3-epimerase [Mesoplasma florum]AVN61666.1 ribulose-phosphate 3-epimerase [Mesoplasma florum]AVN65719.1 Ribulose-phosphate 3-epimerase [Mesoplasma florum]
MKFKTAVSIYVFNFLEVGNKIDELVKKGVDWIHVDIMDGNFVNNYALCQKFCKDIKDKYPNVLIDAHLMCLEPQRYIKSFAENGTNHFNFHYESVTDKNTENLTKIIQEVKSFDMKAVIAINPETSPEILKPILDKVDGIMCMSIKPGFNGQKLNEMVYKNIEWLSNYKKKNKSEFFIQVDGGVREETYLKLKQSGAEIMVVGAFVNVPNEELRKQIEKIEGNL